MDETTLKSALMEEVGRQLSGFVALRHEDVRTSGVPDISLTGRGRTSWLEAKYAAPDFKSVGIQELTMLRLAAAGYARYVIWEEKRGVRRTLLVHPRHLGTWEFDAEASCGGFDHKFVVEHIRRLHGA